MSGPAPAPVLELRALRLVLRSVEAKVVALDGVDLAAPAGALTAVVGERGAGKSALAAALLGLPPPPGAAAELSGAIRLAGRDLLDARPAEARRLRRAHLRALLGDPAEALDPARPLAVQFAAWGAADPDAAAEALRRAGLDDPARLPSLRPGALAPPERRHAALALAAAAGPALLLADEPAADLAPAEGRALLALLRRLAHETGAAVLLLSHDLAAAAEAADHLVILQAGRVVETGPAAEILARPAHAATAELLAARIDLAADRAGPLPIPSARPPGAAARISGCAFAPRCPLAIPRCERARPALRALAWREGRSACLRAEDVRPAPRAAPVPWPRPEAPPPPPEAAPALTLEAATLHGPGPATALDAVTLALAPAEALALLGPPGAGKTALLHLAAGLARPDAGRVARGARDRPQMTFQAPLAGLAPGRRLGLQLAERLAPLRLPAREVASRIRGALAEVGLQGAEPARPEDLPPAERRRAALARAVILPPSLLLLDAPLEGMDPADAAATLNLIGRLRRRLGFALILATRDPAVARLAADRIAVLDAGRLAAIGPAERLAAAPVGGRAA